MISISSIHTFWLYFFFESPSAMIASFIRILTGICLLINAYYLIKNRDAISPNGWLDDRSYSTHFSKERFSFFNYLPSSIISTYSVLLLYLASSLSVIFGFFTKPALIIVFLCLTSINNRNIYILSAGDAILKYLVFFLFFTPCAAFWAIYPYPAIDSFLGSPVWGIRLIQIMICIIYMRSVYWKLRGTEWRDGTASYLALSIPMFRKRQLPQYLLRKEIFYFFTYTTLTIEALLGPLLWVNELRLPLIFFGVIMHLSFQTFMKLDTFQWAMITGLLSFLSEKELVFIIEKISYIVTLL